MSTATWTLLVLTILLPFLGALYWGWYRSSLDAEKRLDKPSGAGVFVATFACAALAFAALYVLLVIRVMTAILSY